MEKKDRELDGSATEENNQSSDGINIEEGFSKDDGGEPAIAAQKGISVEQIEQKLESEQEVLEPCSSEADPDIVKSDDRTVDSVTEESSTDVSRKTDENMAKENDETSQEETIKSDLPAVESDTNDSLAKISRKTASEVEKQDREQNNSVTEETNHPSDGTCIKQGVDGSELTIASKISSKVISDEQIEQKLECEQEKVKPSSSDNNLKEETVKFDHPTVEPGTNGSLAEVSRKSDESMASEKKQSIDKTNTEKGVSKDDEPTKVISDKQILQNVSRMCWNVVLVKLTLLNLIIVQLIQLLKKVWLLFQKNKTDEILAMESNQTYQQKCSEISLRQAQKDKIVETSCSDDNSEKETVKSDHLTVGSGTNDSLAEVSRKVEIEMKKQDQELDDFVMGDKNQPTDEMNTERGVSKDEDVICEEQLEQLLEMGLTLLEPSSYDADPKKKMADSGANQNLTEVSCKADENMTNEKCQASQQKFSENCLRQAETLCDSEQKEEVAESGHYIVQSSAKENLTETSRKADEYMENNNNQTSQQKNPIKCLRQTGILYDSDRIHFVERHQIASDHSGHLPYSARFIKDGIPWRLYGENGLLVSTNKYIAQVNIEPLDALDRTITFNSAMIILLKNLKVTKVFLDVHLQDMQNAKVKYDDYSSTVLANTIDDLQNVEDLFQLEKLLCGSKLFGRVVIADITKNPYISEKTKEIITKYLEMESNNNSWRWRLMNIVQPFLDGWNHCSSNVVLRNNVKTAIRNHKAELMKIAPEILKNLLEKMDDKYGLFITRKDLKLFSDLWNTFGETELKTLISIWAKRYIDSLVKINTNQLKSVLPLTNHIIYYVSKSLLELSEEIATKTLTKNILNYDSKGKWRQIGKINWKSAPSTLDKVLESQIKLLIKLFNHFAVGKSSSCQRFPYQYQVFGNIEFNLEFQQVITQANTAFGSQCNQNMPVFPDEIHVWICLLDDTIAQLFSNDQHVVKMCTTLLKLYLNYSLSGQMSRDSLESLRVITHNTIRFVAQAGSFVRSQNEQDNDILLRQIGFMSRASLEGRMSFADYRDLIEVFAQFWSQRSDAIEGFVAKLPGDCIKKDVEEIQSLLLQCMAEALDKNVQMMEIVNFCRVYEELVIDLQNLSLDWYIRMPSTEYTDIFIKKDALTIVDNKWKDSDRQCYYVKDVAQFIKLYQAFYSESDLPRHFLVETIKKLLKTIVNMESKVRWSKDHLLTALEQLKATGLLITSVRSSLMYLKEQPDYISFDRFLEESVKPFTTVCDKSNSFKDFEKRVLLIKDSFWYIRNLNAIDIDTALKLYKDNNKSNYNEKDLRQCYQEYNKQFEQFMSIDNGLSTTTKIQRIVEQTAQFAGDLLASEWSVEFKQETLPAIIAGLSAVWALHVSKDVASSGQYIKPHCIQILCVFRLLSADMLDQGVRKHLAQVLTGQGKSLVLALVASVLALCGHSVQIMCYSQYLASRDEKDFEEFYALFGIRLKISYQTFEDAACERFNRIAGNAEKYVYNCIGLPPKTSHSKEVRSNPVLLIDEVDVFFDENMYGNTYNIGRFPIIPGLDKIQLTIWQLVQDNRSNIRQTIDNYINNESDTQVAQFKRMMNKSGQYTLLTVNNFNQNIVGCWTNSLLFSLHIDIMISTAQEVHGMSSNGSFFSKFRLNSSGNITVLRSFGDYSETSFYSYYNSFIYFRLKQNNFEQGMHNYGYLNFHLGSTSYAKLPEEYPLILGVSGTLTTLSNYEKKVVEDRYHISELSVMPSFFGGSNLKFHESIEFSCFNTVTEWMNFIFSQINAIISAKRSVLVIFDTDVTINAFKAQFAGQLDRLNVLTVNTSPSDKERFITDAGVARTITLATREMGRGVDYKSSVAVEKNGGVHVIQSFFSVDVKEETQIKGRTARKDNRGSYELIVCMEHLRKEKLVENFDQLSSVSYSRLNESRTRLVAVNDAARDEKLKKANERHDATVEFYKDK